MTAKLARMAYDAMATPSTSACGLAIMNGDVLAGARLGLVGVDDEVVRLGALALGPAG